MREYIGLGGTLDYRGQVGYMGFRMGNRESRATRTM